MRICGYRVGRLRIVLVTGLLMAAVSAAFAGSAIPALAAIHPAWKIAPSPNATVPGGQLSAVSCSSASACTAVGATTLTSGRPGILAERWNGTSWHVQKLPDPSGGTLPIIAPGLLGVSCPAANFCVAVGAYQVGSVGITIADTWNGKIWTRLSFPVPLGSSTAILTQVSCPSARFCEATGVYINLAQQRLPFGAIWNGSSWKLQQVPSPGPAELVTPTALSCVSPKFCEAGGNSDAGSFVDRWNGSSWRPQPANGITFVTSMSCGSASFCELVGGGSGARWNGSTWSTQTIPAPAGTSTVELSGVSCPTAAFCQAVGNDQLGSGNIATLGVRWNGSTWADEVTQNPAGATSASLGAVSCPTKTDCEAVGGFEQGSDASIAIAQRWNGSSWAMQSGVAPPSAANNALAAVSCTTASFCEAVGSGPAPPGLSAEALAEQWNGTSWRLQRTGNPAQLVAISCVTAKFCEAVGSNGLKAGAGRWNGSTWARQAVPGGELTALSCPSSKFCVAAGQDGHVASWNGTSWSEQATAAGFTSLGSVSCASPSFCEATGFGPAGELAERWNGHSWSAQPTPTPAGGGSLALAAVSCTAATSCEAVGQYSGNSGAQLTVAEAWNGTAWKVQSTPNPASAPGDSSELVAVQCASASFCAAVGQFSAFLPTLPLAEVWNGKSWSIRSTPSDPAASDTKLNGVSCVAAHGCTAVGVSDDLGQFTGTLIETGN
jgi:hypothetical protein